MPQRHAAWRATYTPGRWVVLAGPSALVILQPAPARVSNLLNSIWDSVVDASSIDDLVTRMASFGIERMGHFAAFSWDENGMHSLCRGKISVIDPRTGDLLNTGEGMVTWREVGISVDLVRVDMEPVDQESELQLPLMVGAVTASAIVLDATGTVRARFPSVVSPEQQPVPEAEPEPEPQPEPERAPEPESAPEPEPQPEPEPEPRPDPPTPFGQQAQPRPFGAPAPFPAPPTAPLPAVVPAAPATAAPVPEPTVALDVASLGEATGPTEPTAPVESAPAAPAPVGAGWAPRIGHAEEDSQDGDTIFVTGIAATHKPGAGTRGDEGLVLASVCAAGHPNPPGSQRCRLCPAPVAPQNQRLVSRPSLATLVSSAGDRLEVVGAVVIGRAPSTAGHEAGATTLRVPSPSSDISRNHLLVAPREWNLVATDLHSTNGTIVRHGHDAPIRLNPGEGVTIGVGDLLDLGDGVSIRVEPPT
ncbi:FHA domain-containing protein [Aestuariimicrobium kwangyangense]|uniref:FHA domain-containing protein n=1 Tax=Aestuariimicrobium kwangyangense TaxID=396389 RepID=UPI0003B6ABA7|nr:FHA domain-containing protein [Aestuariimicrobium kwangyangense]